MTKRDELAEEYVLESDNDQYTIDDARSDFKAGYDQALRHAPEVLALVEALKDCSGTLSHQFNKSEVAEEAINNYKKAVE